MPSTPKHCQPLTMQMVHECELARLLNTTVEDIREREAHGDKTLLPAYIRELEINRLFAQQNEDWSYVVFADDTLDRMRQMLKRLGLEELPR